jgi:hypothetical protein
MHGTSARERSRADDALRLNVLVPDWGFFLGVNFGSRIWGWSRDVSSIRNRMHRPFLWKRCHWKYFLD